MNQPQPQSGVGDTEHSELRRAAEMMRKQLGNSGVHYAYIRMLVEHAERSLAVQLQDIEPVEPWTRDGIMALAEHVALIGPASRTADLHDAIERFARAIVGLGAGCQAVNDIDAITKKAIQEAYGYLWHVNNEPMAPVPLFSNERAANEARKCLRDLLTHEERGEAINVIRAHVEKITTAHQPAPRIPLAGHTPAECSAAFEWLRDEATKDGAEPRAGVALDAWHAATERISALAQPAAPAQAVGEPITVEAVGEVDHGTIRWFVEGGIAALPDGVTLIVSGQPITGDDGAGEVYTSPQPAAPAHDKVLLAMRNLMGAVNAYEKATGVGGWYAEEVQTWVNALARHIGIEVEFGVGAENPVTNAPQPTGPVAVHPLTEQQAIEFGSLCVMNRHRKVTVAELLDEYCAHGIKQPGSEAA